MGYQVYEDVKARDWGVYRWAGYGVPAECDYEGCDAQIDRGLYYCCEEHVYWVEEGEDELEVFDEGCYKFFCYKHLHETDAHEFMAPKPDGSEWVGHMLTHESWEEWRTRNPKRVNEMKEKLSWDEDHSTS